MYALCLFFSIPLPSGGRGVRGCRGCEEACLEVYLPEGVTLASSVPTSPYLTLYWFYFSPLSDLVLSFSRQLLVIFHNGFFRDIIATYFDTLPYTVSIIFVCHMMLLMVLTFCITPKLIHDMTCFH